MFDTPSTMEKSVAAVKPNRTTPFRASIRKLIRLHYALSSLRFAAVPP